MKLNEPNKTNASLELQGKDESEFEATWGISFQFCGWKYGMLHDNLVNSSRVERAS